MYRLLFCLTTSQKTKHACKTPTNLFLIIIKIMQLGEKESACGVCDCEYIYICVCMLVCSVRGGNRVVANRALVKQPCI